jgi:hypothetical protein
VDGETDGKAAIAAAQAAGLSAVAVKGFSGKSDFPVIAWGDRGAAPWNTTAPVLPVTDNVWPGVAGGRRDATAGPTALPWLDSNGWFLQLARAKTQKPIWIVFDPPGKNEVVPPRSYQTAVCDVGIGGGTWVISLDDAFREGLLGKAAASKDAWAGLTNAVDFFVKHPEWKTYKSLGSIAVVSDFSGDNYVFCGELLNALTRRDLLCRALCDTGKPLPPLTGVKVVLRADAAAPSAAVKTSLLAYVQQGGTLVVGPKWGADGQASPKASPDFNLRTLGKGRIAVAKEEPGDPWEFVTKAQSFISHSYDVAKLFNSSASGGFTYANSPDGKRALLQLLSYSSFGGGGGGRAGGGRAANPNPVIPLSSLATAWTRHKYRSAQLWTLDAAGPRKIEVAAAEDGGTEYHLPGTSAYMALDCEV